MGAFDDIKDKADIATVVEQYGGVKLRNNECCCPLHSEKTPSFRVYPRTNSFYCFGCGVGGTVIDFTSKLFGITTFEAARKLNADFALGVANLENRKQSRADKKRRAKERAERKRIEALQLAFDEWADGAFIIVRDYFRLLAEWADLYRPATPADRPDERFVYAMQHLSRAEYLTQTLAVCDVGEMFDFYMCGGREEVEWIEQLISRQADTRTA